MDFINTTSLEYPITEREVRARFPETSLPENLTSHEDYVRVAYVDPPEYNKLTSYLGESVPVQVNGVWSQVWVEVQLPDNIVQANYKKANDEFIYKVKASIQSALDQFVATRGYDNIISACTYASSKNAKRAAEGQYCVEMRDTYWDIAFDMLNKVEKGEAQMPATIAEAMTLLPELVWPVE